MKESLEHILDKLTKELYTQLTFKEYMKKLEELEKLDKLKKLDKNNQ